MKFKKNDRVYLKTNNKREGRFLRYSKSHPKDICFVQFDRSPKWYAEDDGVMVFPEAIEKVSR